MFPLPTVLAIVLAVLAPAAAAAAQPATVTATTVRVTAGDFWFKLSTKTVAPGRVTFRITNVGRAPHDFAIAGRVSKTIAPGSSTTLTVTLRRGRYPYRCTVDSHAELGMKGVLRVGSA